MGNTDHTPVNQENHPTGNKAQSASSPNTQEDEAHNKAAIQDGNSTTGKGSVEQDDEDIGGDQDREPNPKIAPVIDGVEKDEDEGGSKKARDNGNNGNPAQSSGRVTMHEQNANPEPMTGPQ